MNGLKQVVNLFMIY